MTFASILTVLTGAKDDGAALETAARMAHRAQGVVNVILAPPLKVVDNWAQDADGFGASPAVLQAARRAQDKLRRDAEAHADALTERLGLERDEAAGRILIVEEQGVSALDLSDLTPFTDLVVVGRRTLNLLSPWGGLVFDTLYQAQIPILAVSAPSQSPPSIVAIAWNGGLAAARAVRAALPILASADQVVILQDPAHLRASQRRTAQAERLIDYLRRHDVGAVTIRREADASRDDGFVRLAAEHGAELLVAGAYEHSRLREDVLGGVTASLIAKAKSLDLFLHH